MNRKIPFLALALALAGLGLAGWWTARSVYRARHDLVTLHVRDLPLPDVLRQLERQTRESIVADPHLDARITLDAEDEPLVAVLDRVAEQAGALSRATHTVHRPPVDVARLGRELAAPGDQTPAAWTNLSAAPLGMGAGRPGGPPPDHGDGEIEEVVGGGAERPPGPGNGGRVRIMVMDDETSGPRGGGDADVLVKRPGGPPGPGGRRMVVRMMGASADGDGNVLEFDLSPSRVLLESVLAERMGENLTDWVPSMTAEDADRLAKHLGVRRTTIHVLSKSPAGALPPQVRQMLRNGPMGGARHEVRLGGPDGPAGTGFSPENLGARAEAEAKQGRFDRLNRLTPEQRAREAAERGGQTRIVRRHDESVPARKESRP